MIGKLKPKIDLTCPSLYVSHRVSFRWSLSCQTQKHFSTVRGVFNALELSLKKSSHPVGIWIFSRYRLSYSVARLLSSTPAQNPVARKCANVTYCNLRMTKVVTCLCATLSPSARVLGMLVHCQCSNTVDLNHSAADGRDCRWQILSKTRTDYCK